MSAPDDKKPAPAAPQEEPTPEAALTEFVYQGEGAASAAPNSGNRQQVKAQQNKKNEREHRLSETLKIVLSQPNGRELIAYIILELGGIFDPRIPLDGSPQAFAFLAGRNTVAATLQDMALRSAPNDYMQLLSEHLKPKGQPHA